MPRDRFERAERRAWWWPVTVAPALTSAAWILWLINIISGQTLNYLAQVLLMVAGMLSALSAIGVSIRKLYLERQARTTLAATFKKNLNDVLVPVFRRVVDIIATAQSGASSAKLKDEQDSLKEFILGLAKSCASQNASQCRASFYSLSSDSRSLTLVGRPVGRENGQGPLASFDENSQLGRMLINLVTEREVRLIEDVDRENIAAFSSQGSGYASLACAPVYAGDERFGLLTIDSPQIRAVSQDDMELVRTLAQLLGAALVVRCHNPAGQ